METLRDYLPLIIPLIVVQLALVVAALIDLAKREQTRGPKWLWLFVILFVNLIGPVAYFLIARDEE